METNVVAEVDCRTVRAANTSASSSVDVDSAEALEVGNTFGDRNCTALSPRLTGNRIANNTILFHGICQIGSGGWGEVSTNLSTKGSTSKDVGKTSQELTSLAHNRPYKRGDDREGENFKAWVKSGHLAGNLLVEVSNFEIILETICVVLYLNGSVELDIIVTDTATILHDLNWVWKSGIDDSVLRLNLMMRIW